MCFKASLWFFGRIGSKQQEVLVMLLHIMVCMDV